MIIAVNLRQLFWFIVLVAIVAFAVGVVVARDTPSAGSPSACTSQQAVETPGSCEH